MMISKNEMKFLAYTSVFMLLLISSCKEKESTPTNFFASIQLTASPLTAKLKMDSSMTISTNNGFISFKFIASDLCSQDNCSTCDGDASIRLFFKHNSDSVELPIINIHRCSDPVPTIYSNPDCKKPYGTSYIPLIEYQNIIFGIIELSPYPKTYSEIMDFYYNKKYILNFTILNTCE